MVTRNSANTYIVPTVTNEVTAPAQPAFLAYLGSTVSDATGDGTVYALGTGTALTEVFDQNADFSGTQFIAPVTGKYVFSAGVYSQGYDGTQTLYVNSIVTSHGDYEILRAKVDIRDAANEITTAGAIVTDLDAADAAAVYFTAGNGNKVIDVASSSRYTFFSGYLAV